MKKALSVYFLLIVGILIVVEPLFPQYEFSLFWFLLGIVSIIISLFDIFREGVRK